jgi:hypothetical protein
MPVSGWIRLLKNAGFDSIDVLLRDADEVILASSKPDNPRSLQDDEQAIQIILCGGGS